MQAPEQNNNQQFQNFKNWRSAIAAVLMMGLGYLSNVVIQWINADKDVQIEEVRLEKDKVEKELEIVKQADAAKQAQEQAFDDITFIYDELAELVENTGAARAIIISVHNGGREIRVGGEKKFDILYEVKAGNNIQRIKSDFQNYVLDEGNIRLASRAIDSPTTAIHIPDVYKEPILDNDETLSTLRFLGIGSLTCKYIGGDAVTQQNMFFLYLNHEITNPEKELGNDFITNYASRSGRLIRQRINAY